MCTYVQFFTSSWKTPDLLHILWTSWDITEQCCESQFPYSHRRKENYLASPCFHWYSIYMSSSIKYETLINVSTIMLAGTRKRVASCLLQHLTVNTTISGLQKLVPDNCREPTYTCTKSRSIESQLSCFLNLDVDITTSQVLTTSQVKQEAALWHRAGTPDLCLILMTADFTAQHTSGRSEPCKDDAEVKKLKTLESEMIHDVIMARCYMYAFPLKVHYGGVISRNGI